MFSKTFSAKTQRFTRIRTAVAMLCLCILHAVPAVADEITAALASFDSTTVQAFQLNGVAALNGSSIRLTPNSNNQAGSAFWKNKVSLAGNRSFSAYFTFRMTSPGGTGGGADGIVFTIQSQSNSAGSSGGGIGFSGIANSFGIEFDSFDNGNFVGFHDPDANHIGVDLNGSVDSVTTVSVSAVNGAWSLKDGHTFHAWVDYDGATDTLEVRLNRDSDARPGSAALTYTVDLATVFPQDVYFGFTAATGGGFANHLIDSFYFNSTVVSGGIIPDTVTYTSAPNAVVASANPTTVDADGVSTTTITATVTDVANAPLSGKTVTFSTNIGTLGSAAVTNGSGVTTVTLTAPSSVGTATVRGSVSGGAYGEATVTFINADPDGDGVNNIDEVAAGTDPNDRGSAPFYLGSTICSDWNGYWNGLFNVFEHFNQSGSTVTLTTSLLSDAGSTLATLGTSLATNEQFDILVHDIPERQTDRYGLICTNHSGSANDVDGRLVYYKLAPGKTLADPTFDFAFGLDVTSGQVDQQAVLFNTFNPSLDPSDSDGRSANWIVLANVGSSTETGTMTFYGQDGTVLGTTSVSIGAKEEQHFAAHGYGYSMVGLADWVPDDATARFSLRNLRYVYDNSVSDASFISAGALEGAVPSGGELIVPVDATLGSAILEIGNTAGSSNTVTVDVYSEDGTVLDQQTYVIPAHATQHVILDSVLAAGKGVAIVDGSVAESVVAYALHYGRTSSGGVNHMYASALREALATTVKGSYNTWFSQTCSLRIANSTGAAKTATISLKARDGSSILGQSGAGALADTVNVPAFGSVTYDVCSHVSANQYGTVSVQSSAAHSLVANLIRIGQNGEYRFVVPLH